MKIFKSFAIVVIVVSMAFPAFSAETKRTARVLSVSGQATVKKADGKSWVPAKTGMILNEGDTLKTREDSWAVLNLNCRGETANVEVEENSELGLVELAQNIEDGTQSTLLDLAIGQVLIKAKKLHKSGSRFEVKTPTAVVGVRGTKFSVTVEALED